MRRLKPGESDSVVFLSAKAIDQTRPKAVECSTAGGRLMLILWLAATLFATPSAAGYSLDFEKVLSLDAGRIGATMPVAVTIDPLVGEICITDTRQAVFHLLNAHDVQTFRTDHVAQLSYPADGSVDADGRIVFLDSDGAGGTTIRRLSVLGEPDAFVAESPAEGWTPRHLVITSDGAYLTLAPTSGILAKHDPRTGALLWQRFCGLDAETGEQLGRPAEAPDGRIYVPGGDLRVTLVLDAEGHMLEAFGRFGSAPGRVILPVGVAFGPDGEVLVLDRLRGKILIHDADHQFVTEFGSIGYRPGQFYHPLSMAADDEGRVYVTQGFRGRVQIFRLAQDTAH
jgi:DNA-binding beta-propeller fold protein YncE